MQEERRLPANKVTPQHEDVGLFSKKVGQFQVELVPRFGENGRGDLLVMGFVQGDTAVEVAFAGRRTKEAKALITHLKTIWTRANQNLPERAEPPKAEKVRCKVLIEGSWRPKYEVDKQGWQTHQYHLLAARWSFVNTAGKNISVGEPPLQ